ncbi:SDR family NAD(P)-dependent oxidoreductase [Glaciihabitans sp. UYNi722]|uniref:SDR family NAD(P)-dependent oxidoreductase n=1 Tax=Glaciihabitans sp. UYNi722 TaxID=3156344 RepID=UPI003397D247
MNIADSVAIVTGGASGLGLATARNLTAAGARVVVLDLEGQRAAAEAAQVAGTTFVAADVTSEKDVAAAVGLATSLGSLRILVNCAGVAPAAKVLGRNGTLPLEDFERGIRINLFGTFNVLRLVAERMVGNDPIDDERGVIVNTASVAAFDGQIGQASYAASKGAVAAMTLPIARELASSLVRVVTIAPGIFETPMMAGLSDKAQASLGEQVPHPARLGRPSEYASLVRHIVENPYLNGETIRLDGAIRMAPR